LFGQVASNFFFFFSFFFFFFFFFFTFLGSFSLCFRKHLRLMAYFTIPVLDIPTFSTSSVLPRTLSRESWSCKPVIWIFKTFVACHLREILVAKKWNYVGYKWPVNLA
jgi:hypothetical protein